ncbi:F0F1 ATP synthase subunit B [Natronospira bacteriovora]|uniref:ATP synthase subunit b n=1 Tax=Natronospira bacteriovora TaxID=3069753 RepID=A0ABU0W6U2_9GAMM|nr:F0F1 ATP synthase subunit B [Natronospira sp. AB-CW4]MDQ2069724.1 F0F1 ATP synthase subunit B [Natronospira sp. AB-CW4]
MNLNATILGQIVTFAILVWLTLKFVWPPLVEAMRERREKIAEGLAAAEKGNKALEEASTETERLIREAREQSSEIIAQANRRSTEMIEEAKAEARREGERLLENARAQIEQDVARARAELRQEVAELTVLGAGRILGREVDAKAHGELLDRLAKEL